jgi:4-hydroxy-3-polyprenylbenzoate decarboxylase
MGNKKKIIIGISGASGIAIAAEVIRGFKKNCNWEIYLVITDSAKKTAEIEYSEGIDKIYSMVDVICSLRDISHGISSGTFVTEGMIVVPCSMKTLAGISNGFSDNLLLRAADVTIKQRKKLVLVPRETPLSVIHLKNMLELSKLGCVILPPMLTYYNMPKTVEDMTAHIAGKILDEFGVDLKGFVRWNNV